MEADENSSSYGLRLLGQHLAKVKLEAEERVYQLKQELKRKSTRIDQLEEELKVALQDVESFKSEIKHMQSHSSRKELLSERDRWKKLVDTLRAENAELKEQLILRDHDENDRHQSGGTESHEHSISANAKLNTDCNSDDSLSVHSHKPDSLRQDSSVALLKLELQEKEQEIEALKRKLDFELEMKWSRQQQSQGWRRTLIDSFKEVIAPLPSPTLDAISEKGYFYDDDSDKEMKVV